MGTSSQILKKHFLTKSIFFSKHPFSFSLVYHQNAYICSINTTHTEIKNGWQQILLGYKKTNPNSKQIIQQIKKIEKRIRYA